jgi:hypothetical protein
MIMMMKEEAGPPVADARARARGKAKIGAGAGVKMRVHLHGAIVLPAAQAEAVPVIRAVALPACLKKKYAV